MIEWSKIQPLRFWRYPTPYTRQPITIPAEYVESIVLRAVGHEAGHIIAAHHYNARVLGIAIEFESETRNGETVIEALYESQGWSNETRCIVYAAGPAADVLCQGGFSDESASGDLHDIEVLTGEASLEPYLSTAKEILARYPTQFNRIVATLRANIENGEERDVETLAGNRHGAYLLTQSQLVKCLTRP